jgi:hypothetical protein
MLSFDQNFLWKSRKDGSLTSMLDFVIEVHRATGTSGCPSGGEHVAFDRMKEIFGGEVRQLKECATFTAVQ